MNKLLFLFLLSVSLLFSANDIDTKIKSTSKKLSSFSKNYSKINKKMAQTAKAIIDQKKELAKQEEYLEELKAELESKATSYKDSSAQLEELRKKQEILKQKQEKIEEELVFVIAQSVSLSIILQEDFKSDADSLIELEVLKSMLHASQQKAKDLSDTFVINARDIEFLQKNAISLESSIKEIDDKRKNLLVTKEENKKALKKLEVAKASYKKELEGLLKRQNALKDTLSQLNLIKVDQQKKEQEEKERKEALAKKDIYVDNQNLPKVKKHGSSYQAMKTIEYRGPKTIAPLNNYTITKNYGTYTDPIYGIKIFNESISLKPKKADAKVRTVFNGKVIYADKTAVLDNIVIVEHDEGLHTIYANLSQIAPNIKTGKKIKKGYTIGRVKDELVFEVTKKTYHINPIRLFR
ncbi:peptidoglycan DD-metalloendopeptidase family protein [Sulfurimonas sp. C5]|uniref:murein hydrolase activator EnvC family protein n=1 Tax=Sulfurimonas sp. C5 TaxID=3036947 RepID=UPI002456559E|nr:peptidoglycan DD-metalloendopeptidase family protein [Sulfurimonas sp. C5]MDH4943679.1 peptidoglycan DD-metalloendopeptidase family protein [Sulfurimonas sp. C5]